LRKAIDDFSADLELESQRAADKEERWKAESVEFFKFDPSWTWD
jgi:hypothetical protein